MVQHCFHFLLSNTRGNSNLHKYNIRFHRQFARGWCSDWQRGQANWNAFLGLADGSCWHPQTWARLHGEHWWKMDHNSWSDHMRFCPNSQLQILRLFSARDIYPNTFNNVKICILGTNVNTFIRSTYPYINLNPHTILRLAFPTLLDVLIQD